ncbi:hypothetical protein Pla175_27240 [Pirellulimonas nuda]|uniref:O-Antigen ligase n=1 Tax=Pirellulimonas nuda TaxID=2528009 RepID=A0A518DCX7_9BACT|nr:O-antigen ligase domain-containing protein [Pirellulimonas nuda]QDU89335.1 hypothetical protein Pla175_27240 [Pirellulimonas nuda]
MSPFAHIMLLCWLPAILLASGYVNGQKLVVFAVVFGWLALPNGGYDLAGLPDYTKTSATTLALVLVAFLLGNQQVSAPRFQWFDLLPIAICVAPLFSSISNGLGLYDGVSAILLTSFTYGFPYAIGRTQLCNQNGLRMLCIGILAGSLIYVPLCLLEMRLSPQLHNWIYGYSHRWNAGGHRLGGWRPIVFLDGGLQLAMWMSTATLIGGWLWRKGVWRSSFGIGAGKLTLTLLATALLCRSAGALVLLCGGALVLWVTDLSRSKTALAALLLMPPTYMTVRTIGEWSWQPAVEVARALGEDRANSLRVRFENEDLLLQKAIEKPLFGWGGWGRSRAVDADGKDCITDGMWIIQLGEHGFFGLISTFALFILPLAMMLWNYPSKRLCDPELAAPLVLSVSMILISIDNLMNDMPNPVYIVGIGAVVGFAAGGRRQSHVTVDETQRRLDHGAILPRSLSYSTK